MAKTKTIQQLRSELKAKVRKLEKLQKQRAKVLAQLAGIDKQIAAIRGSAPAGGGKTTRKKTRKAGRKGRARKRATGKPLVDYAAGVLAKAKKAMRVKDVMAAVKTAGYKSSSKDFYTIVAAALRDTAKFKRVGRGLYQLK